MEFAFECLRPGLAWFRAAAWEVQEAGVRTTGFVDQEDLVGVAMRA
ncbi:hypothetical protein BJY22_006833 [Kribbella shirazensis]|uniref:Uncharacterized protein n=1 Tax=Kribbella shirazensis TaxID=1105143 RepID=A0A7X6A452_9ACTN|nr:hypothetical protein [Kribbella shirazensis]NIK61116.1 hypothetical protein [Kribbella shirazensis]